MATAIKQSKIIGFANGMAILEDGSRAIQCFAKAGDTISYLPIENKNYVQALSSSNSLEDNIKLQELALLRAKTYAAKTNSVIG